jgi:hypothetical protein
MPRGMFRWCRSRTFAYTIGPSDCNAVQAAQLANIHAMLSKYTGPDTADKATIEQLLKHVLNQKIGKRAGSYSRLNHERAHVAHLDIELRAHRLEQKVCQLRQERDALLDHVMDMQV